MRIEISHETEARLTDKPKGKAFRTVGPSHERSRGDGPRPRHRLNAQVANLASGGDGCSPPAENLRRCPLSRRHSMPKCWRMQ
jgi:hypothetical protein